MCAELPKQNVKLTQGNVLLGRPPPYLASYPQLPGNAHTSCEGDLLRVLFSGRALLHVKGYLWLCVPSASSLTRHLTINYTTYRN